FWTGWQLAAIAERALLAIKAAWQGQLGAGARTPLDVQGGPHARGADRISRLSAGGDLEHPRALEVTLHRDRAMRRQELFEIRDFLLVEMGIDEPQNGAALKALDDGLFHGCRITRYLACIDDFDAALEPVGKQPRQHRMMIPIVADRMRHR